MLIPINCPLQAIPMLPPLLCEELCSLNPGVDRLAYSCIWRMNPDGTLVNQPAWFGRTVIRSCSKLDYNTAQLMIEGTIRPDDPSSITPDLWDPNRQARRKSWNRMDAPLKSARVPADCDTESGFYHEGVELQQV